MLSTIILSILPALTATALPISPNPPAGAAVLEQPAITERDNWSVTRDELSNGACRPVTLLFARGTVELGNVGSLAGPPFFNAFANMIGDQNVAVQGVDYPATIAGYLEGGDPAGAAEVASLTELAASKCPNTQIILSGYSQGAQVVHLGIQQLSPSTAARVNAVVFFGDPDEGQALQAIAANKAQTYCFESDLICEGLPIVLPAHLSYAVDAIPAANFVASNVHV